jgi:Arc/MetJ-type ribon-helix-helix transcriptional regulator
MARPKPYKPGEERRIPVDLDADLNLALWTYCEATRRSNHSEVIRQALSDFLSAAAEETGTGKRMEEARRGLLGEDTLRLVPSPGRTLPESAKGR